MSYDYKDYRVVEDVVKVPSEDLTEKMFKSYDDLPENYVPNNTEYIQVLEDVREIARGTTGKHMFIIAGIYDNFEAIQITYTQNSGIVLEKDANDVAISSVPVEGEEQESITIEVPLTQEETLKFNAHTNAYVQLKLKDKSGKVYTSDVYRIIVYEALNDTVI